MASAVEDNLRTPTSGKSRAEVELIIGSLRDELHQERAKRRELEISSREVDKELRNLKCQVGGYERARNDATKDHTEARMTSRLLEDDLKAAKREVEDAKALMKLYEREAEMSRADAEETRQVLQRTQQELVATRREMEVLKAQVGM